MALDAFEASGVLTNGRLRVRNWPVFAAKLKQIRSGEVTISVERKRAHRSLQANAYLWGCVYQFMAEETGHTVEELHEDMKLRFLTKTIVYVNHATGEIEERQVPGSSASLSVNEFYEFVSQVKLFAAEFLGLTIPEPNEP